ncbi:MAG: D-glycero-beta-D-manno-heptose-7-phosphate kinase [Thermodesulfobacteriaceae bacterium]|nr:D-glycero-beta-D-manno-heptose-7-phosphate kinase [Thermodesulfobacteriaceae bacterium]MCX8041476.1 D-glycero-beta-D-manno-heptose-7-phosphate kinase [Thermodesulfobacteriaceae bacterium]MDW8135946.1 D-glycero-beta-D-manno-heptose-7-phosphate kinase [Thermodesulfobacterium sp.]
MNLDFSKLEENLSKIKILVIGDCILDRYFTGEVNRISPEAPVPVFELKGTYYSLGGAANVASNLRGLKVKVELLGVVGKDEAGKIFKKIAEEAQIGITGILEDETRPTTLKTRIIAQSQHLLRIDVEERKPINLELQNRLINIYERLLQEIDGVIFSDYAKGVFLSEEFCKALLKKAKEGGKFVLVDPKSINWQKYASATCITPNFKEFQETALREGLSPENLEKSCQRLLEKYHLKFIVVTLGKNGIFLFCPENGTFFQPAQAKEVYDVSGAGDTVIASLGAFYAVGLPLKEVITLANLAAGIVVGKIGTKPVYLEEIQNFLKEKEIF